jgi:hypothetical protein
LSKQKCEPMLPWPYPSISAILSILSCSNSCNFWHDPISSHCHFFKTSFNSSTLNGIISSANAPHWLKTHHHILCLCKICGRPCLRNCMWSCPSLSLSSYFILPTPSHDPSTILTNLWSPTTVTLTPPHLVASVWKKGDGEGEHIHMHMSVLGKILKESCCSPPHFIPAQNNTLSHLPTSILSP